MTTQLPVLGADGIVSFATPGDFDACWSSSLSRGALIVRAERELRPLEQVEVRLVVPGLAAPLHLKAEPVSIQPERVMLRLLDGPPARPVFSLGAAPSMAGPPSPVAHGGAPTAPAHGPAVPEPPPSALEPANHSATSNIPVALFGEASSTQVLLAPPGAGTAGPPSSGRAPPTREASTSAASLGAPAKFTGDALVFKSLGALMSSRDSLTDMGAVLAATSGQIPAVPVEVGLAVGPLATRGRTRVTLSLAAPGTAVVQVESKGGFIPLLEELENMALGDPAPPEPEPSAPTAGGVEARNVEPAPAPAPAPLRPPPAAPESTLELPTAASLTSAAPTPAVSASPAAAPAPFTQMPGAPGASKELRSFMKSVFEKYTAVEDPAKTPRQLSFAREGTLHNPTTPQDILNLPLSRPPNDDELAFPSTPLLLRWLRTTRGVLRLEVNAADQPVYTAIFVDGREVRTPASLATLGKSMAAPSLTYTITELGRPPQLTTSGRTLHLIGEVVRSLCSQCELEHLALAYPEREGRCPRALPDIVAGLGLPPQHQRFIKTDVNGSHFLHEIARAPVGGRVVWESLYLLELYNGLSWDDPPESKSASRTTGLPRTPTPAAMRAGEEASSPFDGKDHFQVLGLHWSSSPAEVGPAFQRVRGEFAPGGIKRPSDEKLAERILRQIDDAHRVLSETEARRAYRREKYNLVWTHQAQLLVQKAKMSLYRKDLEEAENILLAAEDMSPSAEAQSILAAIRKKRAPAR